MYIYMCIYIYICRRMFSVDGGTVVHFFQVWSRALSPDRLFSGFQIITEITNVDVVIMTS